MERVPIKSIHLFAAVILVIILKLPAEPNAEGDGIMVNPHEGIILLGNASRPSLPDGVSGEGTEESPYLISYHWFNTTGGPGVSIINSKFHVVIRHCLFTSKFPPSNAAIIISNSSNVVVEGCRSYYATVGVDVRDSSLIEIRQSAWLGSFDGIYVRGHNVTINDCLLSHIRDSGIHINRSRDITMTNVASEHNNAILGYSSGIRIEDSRRSTIVNTSCTLNYGSGIIISSPSGNESSGNRIMGSSFIDNNQGLVMEGCVSSTITDCSFRHNTNGIYISGAKDIGIEASSFFKNTYGVFLSGTLHSSVTRSVFESNEYGIYLDSSDHNELTGNAIFNCSRISLTLDSFLDRGPPSSNNTVFQNTFTGETMFSAHALDNGEDNRWDNGKEGNRWPSHDGPDIDGDGIVDEDYTISGKAGAVDHFPIAPAKLPVEDDEAEDGSSRGVGFWILTVIAAGVASLFTLGALIGKRGNEH
ncbi:MAG: nitrous oxide reductase family maturation protein NosD [Thermoplasmatota archaeon]